MIKTGDLNMRNYVVVIDRSGSMSEPVSKKNPTTRWNYAKESVIALARKCAEYDADGIDIYTFNRSFQRFPNTTADKVVEIFNQVTPNGGTDFVPVLTDVINNHFNHSDKPTSVIVVTDGEPTDGVQGQRSLANLILETSKKIESDNEFGISFIQIGDDKYARDFLKKLDDDMVSIGAKFDICDTKTCDEIENMSLDQVLLDIVND
ncbi:VWA domain-containing protein [Fluviispira vulneris]|uniref:VWA domain-containing protein n=1 Tax=Fluviispira vulneris TaxID=2763012 RepID=UPI0016480F58|nr:VWA domain-containing protein [Fluviispira vulneris]